MNEKEIDTKPEEEDSEDFGINILLFVDEGHSTDSSSCVSFINSFHIWLYSFVC